MISAIYERLLDIKNHSTTDIKVKWEKESEIDISEEEWTLICENQWKCTSSIAGETLTGKIV